MSLATISETSQFSEFANAAISRGEAPKEAVIDVIRVVADPDGDETPITREDQVQEADGTMINSDFLNGMDVHDATEAIMDRMEEIGMGERVTTYRLRDWLISRQRYWGTPIPVVYDPDGEPHLIKDESLPWLLPEDVDFEPTGESPLHSSVELQQRTQAHAQEHFSDLIAEKRAEGADWAEDASDWRPEYDTMDTFVDSSWYYLRYPDSRNEEVFARPERLKTWLPVDFYMIGPEHIVLHLLYARFFTKFLRDQGYLDFDEPFMKMRHQGMILGPDGKKMSKSKGNVINPDDVIDKFGADTLRVYEMFMGPIDADKPWDTSAVQGTYRFLQRLFRSYMQDVEAHSKGAEVEREEALQRKLHQTIEKVTADIPELKFNTAIASMMELLNAWEDESKKHDTAAVMSGEELSMVARLIAPFAPFMAEELYHSLDVIAAELVEEDSVHQASWPTYDPETARADVITIPVQVNGTVRDQLELDRDAAEDEEAILTSARELEKVAAYLQDGEEHRVIYVPGKIINFVVA